MFGRAFDQPMGVFEGGVKLYGIAKECGEHGAQNTSIHSDVLTQSAEIARQPEYPGLCSAVTQDPEELSHDGLEACHLHAIGDRLPFRHRLDFTHTHFKLVHTRTQQNLNRVIGKGNLAVVRL